MQHNVSVVRELGKDCRILAMVKANGYGHGTDWVARTLAPFVDGFGVARLAEAQSLRALLPEARIVLMGSLLSSSQYQWCADNGVETVVHDENVARQLTTLPLTTPLAVWLKLNVGMNRLGMSSDAFCRAHPLLAAAPGIGEIVHMSHFSDADDPDPSETRRQIARLRQCSGQFGDLPLSMANSAGIIAHPDSHGSWLRPGIMLYGDDPTNTLYGERALQPVMTFKSRIVAIRNIAVGEGIGYSRRYRASEPRRIATVGAGYGDGYPRHAPDGTPVLIRGQQAPLAGRVSMDLLTVDITDLGDVAVGEEVTLWGQGLPAAEVGRHCGTISYELFTRVTERVTRYY